MARLSRNQWIIVGAAVAVLAVVGVVVALAVGGGSDKKPAAAAPPPPSPTASATTPPPAPKPTCPLTGRPAVKGQNIHRPTLAVKIDNVDIARPQSGVDRADLVVEETVEGGLTRLFAVFQCDGADTLGPVRSARTTDAALLRLFHKPIFGYSGSNRHVAYTLATKSGAILLSYDRYGSLYHRSSSRPAPHNVYTSTSALVQAGLSRDKHLKPPLPLFRYAAKLPGGTASHGVAIRFSGFASAGWSWNGSVWKRTQNGSPDRLTNGHVVQATNVIVMHIKTVFNGLRDVLGNASPDDLVTGKGKVLVFRNGKVYRGTWTRQSDGDHWVLRGGHGQLLKLDPGRTWVELVPPTGSVTVR